MAHEIDMSNGRANMAYVGETPWHGLGKALTPDAPLEIWMQEAGMDWAVQRGRVRFATDSAQSQSEMSIMDDRHVLFRSDTKAPLSIVSDDYKVVQPREVIEFFRSLVDTAGFKMETAGVLYGGKRMWALARTGDEMRLMGTDAIDGFLLLATSCDGSFATRGLFTTVRTVCKNTLEISGVHGKSGVRILHSTHFNSEQVKKELGLHAKVWAGFEDTALKLADRKVNKTEAQRWLIETFGNPDEPMDNQPNAKLMKEVWGAVTQSPGAGLRSADGTAWGLVNGVTYYFDHVRKTRTRDARLDKAWFGDGANYKAAAVANALKLVA